MSSLNLRRIADAEVLQRVSFHHLVDLLKEEGGDAIASRFDLGLPHDDFPFEDLARILANPPDDFPIGLADALHHVNELADDDGLEKLLDACTHPEVHKLVDPTAADVALRVWMLDRDTLLRVHAERLVYKIKRYETFRGKAGIELAEPDEAALQALHDTLDDWFEKRKKGRHTRVSFAQRGKTTWILIRHGLAMDRRAVIRGNKTHSALERPEKIDVVSYVAPRGELSVHATTLGERELYRKALGKHLFGDEEHFANREKFTFDPILRDGEAALEWEGVSGILGVTLREVCFRYGGTEKHEEIQRAKKDLFASWGDKIPDRKFKYLHRAVFLVQFDDGSKRPRSVKIERPHVASYGREADEDVVNEWLERQGFIIPMKDPAGG